MLTGGMGLSDEEIKASLEVLKALEEAIEKGPWEYNLFFKGIGKKLRDARDRFKDELGLDELTADKTAKEAVSAAEESQFTEVYVSLYQTEGTNIAKWTGVVNSLAGYNMTRPVYRNEADIQEAIRSKEFRQNDAYVAVRVRNDDIMKPFTAKPPIDRYGHELLVLREGSIRLENIKRFAHISGQYQFVNGMLIKQ